MTTKTKQAHTPTPWKAVESSTNGEPDGGTLWLVTEDDETVANLSRIGAKAFEVQRANAAFIVKAVNCHEEFLAALKLSAAELKYFHEESGDCDHHVDVCVCSIINAREHVEKAIAKAEANS